MEECVMYMEKYFLVKKNAYKWAKHWFATVSLSLKESSWSEITLTFRLRKKFCAQPSVKKVMLIVSWDMEETNITDFLEKGATENRASYCQLLWQNSPYLLNYSHI